MTERSPFPAFGSEIRTPQGSVLGLVIFFIIINDLSPLRDLIADDIPIFADDTTSLVLYTKVLADNGL